MASDSVEIVNQLGGEPVVYMPHGGVDKPFKAIIDRRPTQVQSAGGFQYTLNSIEMSFPNDEIEGMTRIQERKDRVRFKNSLDDAEVTIFSVNKVIQEDAGMLSFDGGMFRVMVQA